MLEALGFLGKVLGLFLLSTVAIVLVWAVVGALFCAIVCGLSGGSHGLCKYCAKRLAHRPR